ncbi:MAG: redoxin domain-containing protein [Candidatus Parcubacteria bacterium]|nr:redoxin domain-containing protein [Candidatus Parcubacteria bacterium]
MTKLPEINGHVWIGTEPITLDDIADKVVLVDFWTYSCVNCLRTLPHLREWHDKYKNDGLVIIGIHTPEFEFEQSPENVKEAVLRFGVNWPVVLDNDFENWDAFENKYWPAKYLADREGNIVYTHFGEGGYEETEEKIRELLGLGTKGESEHKEHSHGAVCSVATAEAYCGYMRGNIANELGYAEDAEEEYKENSDTKEGEVNLNGKFFVAHEYAESREDSATLSLKLRGTEVNLVMAPAKGETIVEILWNGKSVPKELRGKDISEEGKLTINRSDMFNLLKSKTPIEGTVTIRAEKGNFRAYAFTFSGCMG